MGNSKSLPLAEKIYNAAKNGKHEELEDLAKRMQALSPEAQLARSKLLEWEDDYGRTPLIVAAAKNYCRCVELLLRCGANVQHVSRKKDGGGSALHEVVSRHKSKILVEKLIRHGASPFVENASGATPLEFAIIWRDVGIVRQFEKLGHLYGSMTIKMSTWGGVSKAWYPKWIAVTPRIPYPQLSSSRQLIRRILYIYEKSTHADPIARVYLDGARSSLTVDANGERQCVLTLHATHPKPKGPVYARRNGTAGFSLFFKNCAQSNATIEEFHRIISLRNDNATAPGTAAAAATMPPTGESDEDFARRLHLQLNPQGTPQVAAQTLYPMHPVHGQSSSMSPYPTFLPAGYGAQEEVFHNSAPSVVHQQLGPQISGTDQAAIVEVAGPSAPPLPDQYLQSAPINQEQSDAVTEGSGKTAEAGDMTEDDDNTCVVCMAAPKEAGFVHGNSVHRCACKDCAADLMKGDRKLCPICRQPIDNVITAFY